MSDIKLPSSSGLASFSHNFDEYGDYLYFERNDKELPSCYENILALAGRRIVIIDPFFSVEEDPWLFEGVKSEGIDIKILTVCKDGKGEEDAKDYYDAIVDTLSENLTNFQLRINCFKMKPYRTVRTGMNNYRKEAVFLWHDRFLLVDDRAFLIGASMNNQVSGEKSFGIYEVKDHGEMCDFIINLYDKYAGLLDNHKNGWYLYK